VPEVPALSGVVEALFAADGPLARALPAFEPRAGQVEMAAAVAHAFEDGGVLLAEAGTGTGKTLAYLIPAILKRERVLISTGTKNLQEQIYFKDIPALRDALGIPFTATCMKGRANYLCLHKLDRLNDGGDLVSHDVFLPIIREWSGRTDTGDRAELTELPEDVGFWNEVSATADTCLGTECPRYDECFVTRMRQRAAESDVVIVNHHLLCADAAVRKNAYGEVIPACSHAIVDEAHQLEDVATQYFGFSISNFRVEDLARDIEQVGSAAGRDSAAAARDVAKAVDTLRDLTRAFFTELTFAHRSNGRVKAEERLRATAESLFPAREAAAQLSGALDAIEQVFARPRLKPSAAGEAGNDARAQAEVVAQFAGAARERGDSFVNIVRVRLTAGIVSRFTCSARLQPGPGKHLFDRIQRPRQIGRASCRERV